MDAVLAALNRAHADYMREAMQAWNNQIIAARAEGANTDACALFSVHLPYKHYTPHHKLAQVA